MSRFINPIPQLILENGDLAAGGTLTFYISGTDTLKSIYADINESQSIANPVTLGSRGEVPNIFYSGSVRCVAHDSDGNQIFDVDPVSGGSTQGQYGIWDSNLTYNQNDTVYGSDGNPYISLVNENEGNDPILNAGANQYWSQLLLVEYYNSQVTYEPNDLVFTEGTIYRSVSASNVGNDPLIDGASNWISLADAQYVVYDNASSGLVAVTGQAAIDEIISLINSLPSSLVYRGQLDVSAGDASLPVSPVNGDLYVIAVAGTITVSVGGGAPSATAVNVGEQIIYNGDTGNWDLIAQVTQASSIIYNNATSGLAATDVQTAIDEIESRLDTAETDITNNETDISDLDSRVTTAESTLSGLGSAATEDVQTSSTDSTADRVLKIDLNEGSFGLGSVVNVPNWPNTSINNCSGVASGLYRTVGTTTNTPDASTTWNVLFIRQNSSVGFSQMLMRGGSNANSDIYFRSSSGGTATNPTWSSWAYSYTDQDFDPENLPTQLSTFNMGGFAITNMPRLEYTGTIGFRPDSSGSNTLALTSTDATFTTNVEVSTKFLDVSTLTGIGWTRIGAGNPESDNDFPRGQILISRNQGQITWNTSTKQYDNTGGVSSDWVLISGTANNGYELHVGEADLAGWSKSKTDFDADYRVYHYEPVGGAFNIHKPTNVYRNEAGLSATKDTTMRIRRDDGTYSPRLEIKHSTVGTHLNHTYSSAANSMTIDIADTEIIRVNPAFVRLQQPLDMDGGDIQNIDQLQFNGGTLIDDAGNGIYLNGNASSSTVSLRDSSSTLYGSLYAISGSIGFLKTGFTWGLRYQETIGSTIHYGNSTGNSNVSHISFAQSNGAQDGYVGVVSATDRNMYLNANAGSLLLQVGSTAQYIYNRINGVQKFTIGNTQIDVLTDMDMNGNVLLTSSGNLDLRPASGSISLEGTTTGVTNVSHVRFEQSDGSRDGYVGVVNGNVDVYVFSDAGYVRVDGDLGVSLRDSGSIIGTFTNTGIDFVRDLQMTSNDITGVGDVSATTLTAATDVDTPLIVNSADIRFRPDGTGLDKVTISLNDMTFAANFDLIGSSTSDITGFANIGVTTNITIGGADVGYNQVDVSSFSTTDSNWGQSNGYYRYTGTGGHTVTVASALVNGGVILLANNGSGTLTIAPTSGDTLNWFNGSSVSTGNRTLAVGGFVTIIRRDASNIDITGSGLS